MNLPFNVEPILFLFTKRKLGKIRKTIVQFHYYPSFVEIFKKFLYDAVYKHICDNDMLTPNQSGFSRKRLSCQSAVSNVS